MHGRIIGDDRQLIGRHVVFSPDDEVAEINAGGRELRSKALIDELQRSPIRHAKAPIMPRGRVEIVDRSTLRPARPWINGFFVFMMRRIGGLKDITAGTVAGINQGRVPQFLPRGKIDFAAFTLDIRRKRSADIRSFIPSQSKPAEIFDDGGSKFRRAPIAVEIFNPENQLSAVFFGAFLRPPEGEGMAEMKVTRRGGSDAAAIGNFRFQIVDFRLA